MKNIYDIYIVIIDQDKTRWSIVKYLRIGLSVLAEIPDLKAVFDRYRLEWMVSL